MRTRALVAAAVVVVVPFLALGSDAPHNASTPDPVGTNPGVACKSCHAMHVALGPALSNQATQFDACQSCHQYTRYTVSTTEKADPGNSGNHHGFEVNLTNPTHGALPPTNAVMLNELAGASTLSCPTCHDQHLASSTYGGAQNLSSRIGAPGFDCSLDTASLTCRKPISGGAGRWVYFSTVAPAAPAKGYLIDMVTPTTFRVSSDGGMTWGTNSNTGTNVSIDGTNASVTFTGTFVTGDRFRFWVSYPFLRVTNVNAAMCTDCHRERLQNHICVEGGASTDGTGVSCTPNGARKYSHPVGEALAKAYDRTAPLDADGSVSPTVDTNPTNDLVLGSGSQVTCLTCHSPHFADSNSLTNDEP